MAVLCSVTSAVGLADVETTVETTVEHALWRAQDVPFTYRSNVTMYDCRTLQAKVSGVLVALGAHAATNVETFTCQVTHLPNSSSQFARLRITLVSPVPATREARTEVAASAARVALLERMGVHTAVGKEFPAKWQLVDLVASRAVRLEASDCELLRQLSEQVLPHLAVNVVARNRNCSRSPQRLGKPTLEVRALVPSGADGQRSGKG